MAKDQQVIPDSLVFIVRRKVQNMLSQGKITSMEAEDLAQELYLKVLQSISCHDPGLATEEGFVGMITDRRARNFVRDARAAKRNPRRSVSLHITVLVDSEDAVELAHQISNREVARRTRSFTRHEQECVEAEIDVAEVISQIPYADRELFRALKRKKLAEVAREMGIPRSTLQSRVAKYRHLFEDAGLREYL